MLTSSTNSPKISLNEPGLPPFSSDANTKFKSMSKAVFEGHEMSNSMKQASLVTTGLIPFRSASPGIPRILFVVAPASRIDSAGPELKMIPSSGQVVEDAFPLVKSVKQLHDKLFVGLSKLGLTSLLLLDLLPELLLDLLPMRLLMRLLMRSSTSPLPRRIEDEIDGDLLLLLVEEVDRALLHLLEKVDVALLLLLEEVDGALLLLPEEVEWAGSTAVLKVDLGPSLSASRRALLVTGMRSLSASIKAVTRDIIS